MQSNRKQIDPKQTWDRQNRYSLRKLSVGLVSVATSAVFFMNAGSVLAADKGVSEPAVEETSSSSSTPTGDATESGNETSESTDKSETSTTDETPKDSEVTPVAAKLAKTGSVTVKYVDPMNNTVASTTLEGQEGEDYSSAVQNNIPSGYLLGDHQIPSGTFSKDGSTITVEVDPAPANTRGTATINYVDESGATVKTITATGFVGDRIDAGSYLPDGYTIAEKDQTSASGKLFEDSPATITVYVKPGSNQDLKNSITKNTPSEDGTELPLSDGTAEGLREKVAGLTKDQYANNKITVSNITFNKDVVTESEGTDLTVSFDWDGVGIRKGDVLVTPMSDAFDSTVRLPSFNFSSASVSNMGTLVLDYDNKKMYVEFRKDLDPSKVYHGSINVGTFVNRDFFKDADNDFTFNIPTPNGDSIKKSLRVEFDEAYKYDKAYVQAVDQKVSDDGTESNVKWAIEVNPQGKYNMAKTSIYITPNDIKAVSPTYDPLDGHVTATQPWYGESSISTELLDGLNSFKVYEAEIDPSLGYRKLKELKRGIDYEVIDSDDPDTPLDNYNPYTNERSHPKNVYVINLMGDYSVTNKKFVVEYSTHHSGLTPDDKTDRGVQVTPVTSNTLVTFSHANANNQIQTHYNADNKSYTEWFDYEIVGASIKVINSSVDASTTTDLRGSVVVTHVDATTGRVLKADGYAIDADGKEMRNVLVGTHYTTNPEYFDGYQFTSIAYDSDNPDGEVEQGVKHVIYQYVPVAPKGSVDVIYISDSGEVLEPWTDVQKDQPEGTEYTTEVKSFDGYKFVRMGKLSADANGTVQADKTLHVIYVYSKVGSVDVKYVDDATGEELPGGELTAAKTTNGEAATDVVVGTGYTTEEKQFEGYHFVGMDKTSSPTTGKVLVDPQHVIYRYAKDAEPVVETGNVDVVYVDEDGKALPGGEVTVVKKDAPLGDSYETTKKEFAGYTFKRMGYLSADANGTVERGTKHVVYVYAKDPEAPKTGSVDVKYIDKETGEMIPGTSVESVKENAPVGEGYYTVTKDFTSQGYRYVGVAQDSDEPAGLVTEGTKHVIYEYEKIKQGSVDVRYIDKETGKDITPGGEVVPVVSGAAAGSAYGTSQKDFSDLGYKFVGMSETSAPEDGFVEADKTLHVIYEYVKVKGSVDVTYVDEQGNVLPGGELTDVKKNAPVGENYTTEQKSFDGYTFSRMGTGSADASGKVTEGTQHVVYVYTKNPEVKKGNVDVTYVTEDGRVLKATELVFKDAQEVGTTYTTEQKEFTGYHFVRMGEFSADVNGKVTENLQHVVYVYAADPVQKKGSVDVKYITKDGKALEDVSVVKDNAPVGEDYTTEEKSFEGYHFVGMDKTSDPATGVVAEGTKHVIYVYEKDVTPEVKKGNVDVTYVTENGRVLKATELVFKNAQEVGADYTTDQKKFTGYHFVRMGEFSADANGKVTENLQHVVYVYAADPVQKKGSVDVKYIAKDGTVLEDTKPVKENAPVGEDYTTEEKSFDGYHFVGMDKTSDPATGVVAEGTKHVIYVYEKDVTPEVKKGNVDVIYVDEQGNVLPGGELTDVKKNAPVGENYTTEQKSFDGYTFSRMGTVSADASGKVTEGTQHVVYVYTKNPETKKGNVDVKYVTKDGEVLEDTSVVKNNAPVGEDYTTEEKSFEGYHFVGMDKTSDSANGKVAEGTKHVIYVYEKDPEPEVKKGNVDVIYVDEQGNVLPGGELTDVKKNAPVGEDYATEEKSFEGYTFTRMGTGSADASGKITEGTQHVIYVYTKNPETKKGNVDVKYVTKDGKTLEDVSVVKDNAPVGEDYTTEEKNFDGYHFVGMDKTSDPANGKVAEGEKHVIYVYEKDVTPEVKKGSVDVKYITTDGTILEDTKSVKENAPVGEDYTTEEKSFDGYHFVGMDKTSDPATGVVAEGTKHVIYVYEKDVTPEVKKGSVDVKYVTKDGKVLEDTSVVKNNVPVGEDYITEEKSFDGYHFVGMDKTSDPATGVVAEGTKHVIYVYEKDPEPEVKKGNVDVIYVDEQGNVLPGGELTDVKKNVPVGESYTTEQKSFDGYTFSRMGTGSADASGKVTEGTQHVVYVYTKNPEVKKGNVDVTYVTEDGRVLKATELVFKDAQEVGKDYRTEQKEFTGYHFVRMGKFSAEATGKVTENLQHVVYVYAADPVEKKGSVDVKYVTKDGKTLEDVSVVKDNAPVGEDYTTEEKSFDGYHFVGMDKTSDPANGKVAEGEKHVIYVYEKDVTPEVKKGNVDVTYVAEDGTVLEKTTNVFSEAQKVGTDYSTEKKTFDGYHFVRMGEFSADASGKVTEGTQHVVYVYAKDQKGSVDVKYITTDGKILEDTSVVKDNAPVGEEYTTEEKSFDGYHFVGMDKTSDPATGKVVEGEKHVIYVYEKDVTPEVKKGSVDVKYITTDGTVLEDTKPVKNNVPVGEDYTTEEKSFDGYHFVGMDKTSDPATGKVVEGEKHVIYVYEKDVTPEVKKGNVDVTYVAEDGTVLEKTSTVFSEAQKVGTDYSTEKKTFDGYHFVRMGEFSADASGKVTENLQHVVYVYAKDQKGSVDVKYITTDGKTLEDTSVVKENAPVGEEYTTEEKSFDGYHFVGMDKTSDPATGKVVEGEKHVIYVYEKNQEKGTVIVHFVDEDGNKISDDVVNKKDVPTGEDYTTTPKDIPGYELDKNKIPSNKDGVVVKGTTEVTYVYHKTPEPTPTPDQPEKPSDETPNQPDQPTTPTTETPNQPEEPSNDTPNKPEEPSTETPTPEVPEDDTTTETTTEKLVLKTHHKKTNKQKTTTSHKTGNNNSSVTKVNNSKARLPQTGEKGNNAASLAGVALLAGATALAVGMIMSKKKH